MKEALYYLLLTLLIMLPNCSLQAQTVTTFVSESGLNGPDGFALDVEGNLYVANWGNGSGNKIIKISAEGEASHYISGLEAPDGPMPEQESREARMVLLSQLNSMVQTALR